MLAQELSIQQFSKLKEKDIKDYEVTSYILKDQVLFSQGKWKDFIYDEPSFNDAFEKTNWDDFQITSLFLDHFDGTPDSAVGMIRGGTATWVGQVKNIHKQGKDLMGDLHVVDLATVNKLAYPGTRWGISAKLDVDFGKGDKVRQFLYKNFSIVVEPAVKTAYINNSETNDDCRRFIKITNYKGGLITMADEKEEAPKEEPKEDSEPVKEKQPAEETEETPKEEEKEEELSEEKLSELEKAAKLVLEFVANHKVENQEEEKKEEPEEEPKEEESEAEPEKESEEEPKEEEPKEEEKAPEEVAEEEKPEEKKEDEPVENKEDKIVKTVEQLSAKINKIEAEKKTKQVENVVSVKNDGLCYNSPTDMEFCAYLNKTILKEEEA